MVSCSGKCLCSRWLELDLRWCFLIRCLDGKTVCCSPCFCTAVVRLEVFWAQAVLTGPLPGPVSGKGLLRCVPSLHWFPVRLLEQRWRTGAARTGRWWHWKSVGWMSRARGIAGSGGVPEKQLEDSRGSCRALPKSQLWGGKRAERWEGAGLPPRASSVSASSSSARCLREARCFYGEESPRVPEKIHPSWNSAAKTDSLKREVCCFCSECSGYIKA